MNWKNLSTQAQGNIGLGNAIAHFTEVGSTVSIPLNDCQDYDLIAEIDNELKRVQVKTTRHKKPSGNYSASMKSSGGTSGIIYDYVNQGSCDYVFILTEDGTRYLIPAKDVGNSSVTLSPSKDKYKV